MQEKYEEIIKKAGLRVTPSRLAVLRTLHALNCPIDVQQIENQLKSQGQTADKVTIYRILEKYVQLGIVKTVFLKEDKLRYELSDEHHHHLVCKNCGKIQAINGSWLDSAEKFIEKQYKFVVSEHTLEFFGMCAACR
ncbi:MAG: Fur family transcriptional regulator [Microgenomates group bacterium]